MRNLTDQQKEMYSRHILLPEIGKQGQLALINASILVIGAGGLGCPFLQYIVAAGVQNITVIDEDVVDVSNLQRQVLFHRDDVGRKKAEVVQERLIKNNPELKLTAIHSRFDLTNARMLVRDHDLVVDGSDNFQTRYLVNDTCVFENKPWIFGSVHRHQGQVSVFNYKSGPTYRCLFPEAPLNVPSCSEAGVLGSLTGTIGSLMANEAIKVLTGSGNALSGKLLLMDLMTMDLNIFNVERSESWNQINELTKYDASCNTMFEHLEVPMFIELINKGVRCIDVREPHEIRQEVSNSLNIPLGELNDRLQEITGEKELIVFCESGKRSTVASSFIHKSYPGKKIFNLVGGMSAFRKYNETV